MGDRNAAARHDATASGSELHGDRGNFAPDFALRTSPSGSRFASFNVLCNKSGLQGVNGFS